MWPVAKGIFVCKQKNQIGKYMIICAQLSCAVRQKFGYQLISKSFVAISLLTKMKNIT